MFENNTKVDNDMELLLSSMDLSELYWSMEIDERKEFLRCIKMEYEGMDDGFSELIERIFHFLEKCNNGLQLEHNIELLMNIYPSENINLVLKSMLEYLKEVLDYLHY
jgi:hypothetical protein